MSPKPLDLKIVGERLTFQALLVDDLKRLPRGSFDEFTADWRNIPTAESLIRRAVEALLDVARHLLSSVYGLGALEYRQAARLAFKQGLIEDPATAAVFEQMAGFRNRLTHHYEDVTPEELFRIVHDHLDDLEAVALALRRATRRMVEPEDG